ncbi:MAG: NAD(P)H-dependent oxidoreductase subunit E [Gammaproteobacteria bacterium]|nr:NAD(P)H-dependent oxidoreductase subunit E [Gammaproteobacteria bacterium]
MNDKDNFPKHLEEEIDVIRSKFPSDKSKSAIIESLLIIQHHNNGYLNEALISSLANYLGLTKIDVYEVATFYSMFNLQPIGKNIISVCTNVSCMLRKSDDIVNYIEKKLNIKVGESTKDNKFYLKDEMECLAACNGAPMMQINHINYENLTYEKIDKILDEIPND